jgi:diamine N-acetyltransferase
MIIKRITFTSVTSRPQIKAVSELAGIIWREHYTAIIGKEQVEYMLDKFQTEKAISEQINKEHYQYYLLSKEGENVGYLAIVPRKDELFLSKIYIKKEYRRLGYGRKSLDFVRNIAMKNKLFRITLSVNRNNTGSIEAYKKFGFKETNNVNVDIGDGFKMCDYKMEYII